MFTQFLQTTLKAYAHKFMVGPILLTGIFYNILASSYSANQNFDMIVSFFNYTALFSVLLFAIFTYSVMVGRKEFYGLFSLSLITLLTSILTILFSKTNSVFSVLTHGTLIVATFTFCVLIKEMIALIDDVISDSASLA